jgi:hypothetical protein
VATCTASQLLIGFRGVQGAAGNWAASFAVANSSVTPCALRSALVVSLTDTHGDVSRSGSYLVTPPVYLSAKAKLPAARANPVAGQKLGVVLLFWAIPPQTGAQTVFLPVSAQLSFEGQPPIAVNNLSLGTEALCGTQFSINDVGSA